MSQLNIPSFIVPPSADWTLFPSSLHVDPGNYRILVTGKLQSHSINTGQCMFKLNLDEGGPNAGAVLYRWQLLQGDPEGLGYHGSFQPNTALSEMGSIASVAPTVQPFIWDGNIEITSAGDLTLMANVTEQPEGPAEVVTFTDVQIEVTPL